MLALTSGRATATIALRGAELRSWVVDDVPLLWEPDADIWPDTAPILFPVVGWTRNGVVEVDGQTFPLSLHGFGRHLDFSVREQWPGHARLVATSNEATRALFPFDWTLAVEHALDGPLLVSRLTVVNTGTVPMPYACGLHPGFRWPFAGGAMEDYTILFGERERAFVPIISAEGLLAHRVRKIPLDGRRLSLSPALMAKEALCFLRAESKGLRFAHGSGAAIDVALENFPHLALWSRPDGRFLSIEAWTGHGDYVDADGDLHAKPSMIHLQPGATGTHAATFSFAPARSLFP